MKLRTKIFLEFTILGIIPLLILSVFAYHRYTQTIYDRMDEISSHLLENAEDTVNSRISGVQQISGTFDFYYDDGSSTISDLQEFNDPNNIPEAYEYFQTSKSYERTCQSLLYSSEYIYGIYIFTPSGYIFECSNGSNGSIIPSYDFESASWYQETLALDGDMYVSNSAVHDFFTGFEESLFFTKCLKDIYSHKLIGVLMIDCKPEMLDLSTVNTMPDNVLLTIDNTQTDNVLYTNYYDLPDSFSSDSHTVYREELNISPLRLTMVVDYDSLYGEFNLTAILIVLICATCIIGLFFFGYLLSSSFTRPVEHLSRKMSSQKGHSLIQTTRYLNRTDEIGTLYNEYNAMVESLNNAVKQDYEDKLIILDAQMKSLEARINSHFLFNTLESINSIAELDDNETIATMSLALGNMFRYTLKTQSELVTVADELNHVQDYVSIQQIRFDNRFKLETSFPEGFENYKVLKLILQPLVENALYHGLNYCSVGDTISISGNTDGQNLFINVRDNGQGMTPETLASLKQMLREEASFTELGHRNKQSIGLKNIHSRIELYYGKGYGLSVASELGQFTNIQIRLPILEQTREE